jgi:transaldolase
MTKIFCDIADLNLIKKFNKKSIVRGFTTNPSLMRKAGAKNYIEYCKKILKIIKNKPVSFEVFGDNYKDIIKQAIKIATLGKNVYVKVPVTNSKGVFLGKIINELNNKNIKLNITAVYTSKQTLKILKKINKKTKIIISIFVGRMADAGQDPMPEIKNSVKFARRYKNVEILWASTREPYNYLQSKQINCHIITIPPSIIEKIEKFGKSFNKLTIDTVKTFLIDSKKSKFTI